MLRGTPVGRVAHAKTLAADGCWCAVAAFRRDLAHAREVTPDAWRRRGPGTRVLEQGARPLARLP